MGTQDWSDEPGHIRELEDAQDADRRADGEIPCAGVCGGWILPAQVVISDGTDCYGPCCAVLGARVDADMVEAVATTIFRNTRNGDGLGVLGRRVSVFRHVDSTWAVTNYRGFIHFVAHDAFEVARRYCLIESGQADYFDLDAPTEFQPTDAAIAEMNFEDRTRYTRRD